MRKTTLAAVAFAFAASAASAQPSAYGPDAARCTTGGGPALLVRVTGLKNRSGTVRVRLFGGSPDTYFDRDRPLVRTQIPVPAGGVVPICVPVPAPGVYAVDVRHDVNGNDKSDMSDGGGVSGNPRPSLWSVLTKRKPVAAAVQVVADRGVKSVPITVLYLQGGKFVPGNGGYVGTSTAAR